MNGTALDILDREDLTLAIRDLAVEAGGKILEIYRTDFAVDRKQDESPVTAADRAAEDLILEGLSRLSPRIPVVAEESFAAGKVPDVTQGRFWLVDPLDGTKEFVNRNGEFTVNIALIEGTAPVLGVVYAPVIDQIYFASGPGHAFRQQDGAAAQPIVARPAPADGLDVLVSRSHSDEKTEAYLEPFPVRNRIAAGSSLKFCLIAAGEGDLYPRIGNTMEWDTAAGHAVLACAGGSLHDLEGEELTYGKPGFRNPPFVARGAE